MKTSKIKILLLYGLEAIIATIIYGLFSYFVVFRILANEVMLYAYIWNIIFMLLFLGLERAPDLIVLSKGFSESKISRKLTKLLWLKLYLIDYISFKTTLYLFYLFILIMARISILDPSLFSDNIRDFLFSIEYCLILLIVFDKLIDQVFKDEKRAKKITLKIMDLVEQKREKKSKLK
jgi:hypothetical protein